MTLSESASLSPEQLRVAVAERLGWTRHSVSKADPFVCDKCGMHYCRNVWKSWEIPYLWCKKDGLENPPNYPESRDACAEFEATITDEVQQRNYVALLWEACGLETSTIFWTRENFNQAFLFTTAKPTQRCRAFLAVSGNE